MSDREVLRTISNAITYQHKELEGISALTGYKLLLASFGVTDLPEDYTVTRLDSWTDQQWAEVVQAIEDIVASFPEEENE